MRYLCTILLVFIVIAPGIGQAIKKQEAKEYFLHQRYSDALAVLGSARNLVRTDEEARFLMAISYYHVNDLDHAQELFSELIKSNKDTYPECWLYTGKIYHAQHRFEKAAAYYKDYLRRLKPNHPNRKMVWDAISRCAVGMRLQYKKTEVVVENLGRALNTEGDEFAPILSPNNSDKLYFSSIRPGNNGGPRNKNGMPDQRLGKHYSDMFSCDQQGGQWANVKAMPHLLNSPRHEVLLSFNDEGNVLYYYKGWSPENGAIYVDTFRRMEERRLSSDPFLGPMNANLGDRQPYFVNDTLVYFSSSRPGGYGGLDIYRSSYQNGQWSRPENLGPVVNSAYDECTPYIARDGRTLYFSSNHSHRSIGGLDVQKSIYNEKSGRWTIPENVGIPINSSADDAYFRISRDGYTAFFSSSRKDGYGERDLYAGYFNSFLPEMEIPLAAYKSERPKANSRKQTTATIQKPQDLAIEPIDYNALESRMEEEEAPPVVADDPLDAYRPMVLNGPGAVLSGEQKQQLDQMAALLKEYEGLKLVITAFNNTERGITGKRIFEGIQTAEVAADYLISRGINAKDMFLRCAAAKNADGIPLNFSFFRPEGFSSQLVLPDLEGQLASALPGHIINKNLIYKVQVFSLKGSSKSVLLENYEHPMVERSEGNGYYRYTLGAYDNFEEAEAFRKKMVELRERSAFVVPYIYGLRADIMMARRNIINFPDLKNYTDSIKKP